MSANGGLAARTPAQIAHARRMVLLLALLFFGPLLLAMALYYGSSWRPPGHSNHGTLIQPPRMLPGQLFHGRWSLVYVGPGECDADCRYTLYYMHQTHLGLGRLYTRVQRVFLATAPCCDHSTLAREYPDLIMQNAAGVSAAALLGNFPPASRPAGIFIVDPHGNLMMRYDAHHAPEGLLDDLKQLLGLSSDD